MDNLDNLARIGKLKKEAFDREEFAALLKSGRARLADARNDDLALESRFDLAYNAAHALALAALRRQGFRPGSRYLVFQCLEFTLGMAPKQWRVLALGHERRNVAEYEGQLEVEEQLIADMVSVAELMSRKLAGDV